ncbi:trypsin-like serine protease [Caproiciproducens sp. NJN-50]|uniref:trypsin-like peptidase domain-containing protein n=1 Tax=Acutalibacteraceae TaxID=3082771 RepID=UPI000FFE109C|nr:MULTISPECIES: trypsin-like peptidase domain-containing protein [Acutalibacteraceae]QAT48409.1 trypsin-like serine protease [Caproiciproducens sp. NJN-50]
MNDNGFDPNSEKDPWEYGDRQQDEAKQESAPQDAAEDGKAEDGEASAPPPEEPEEEPRQPAPPEGEPSGQSAPPPQGEKPPESAQQGQNPGQAPGQPPVPPYGQYGTPPYGGNGYGPYGAPYGSPYGAPYGQQQNYGGYGNQNGSQPGGAQYDNPYGQSYWNYSGGGQYGQPSQPPVPPKKMGTGLKALFWVLGVLVVGLIVGTAVYGYRISNQNPAAASSENSASSSASGEQGGISSSPSSSGSLIGGVEGDGTNPNAGGIAVQPHPSGGELTATEVYKRVIQSVVGVQTTIQQSGTSEGTGIIASSDGYILTNAHVINYSKSYPVKVILHNNKGYEAKVVGYDKTSDLAVLKINATGLSPATFGTVDGMQVGDQVIAIGNPGGMSFAGSLTGGYISALDRSIEEHSDNGMTYIQTDAAINPGNSGGPLVNLYGQVVGINSNKIVATGYEGMGFAIPVSRAKTIIDDLVAHGYVSGRTRLGVKAKTVEELYTQLYGYPQGVLIVGIDSDSSLKNSGAVQGDIITEADGTKITDMDGLYAVLNRHKPGDTIKMKIYSTSLSETAGGGKAGATKEVSVKLLEDKGETQ